MNRAVIHTRLTQLDEVFIRRRIGLLRRTDLNNARIDSLRAKMSDLIQAYGMFVLNIDGGKPIFRARKHREAEKEINLANVHENIYHMQSTSRTWAERTGRISRFITLVQMRESP